MAATNLARSKRRSFKPLALPVRHVVEFLESRRLLSAVTWIGTDSGDFATASDWSTGMVPGPSDDVTINSGPGVSVTVFAGETQSVNSLTTNSPVVVAGSLTLGNGNLTLTGTILEVDSSGGQGDLILGGAAVLGGTGTITLDGGAEIIPTGSGLTIASGITVAQGSSQSASGIVGSAGIPIVNNGTIDAGILNLTVFDLTNNGTLAASDGGILTLESSAVLDASSNVNIGIDFDGAGMCDFATAAGSPASIDGALNITLTNGYVPGQGDQFNVVSDTDGNLTGTFASIVVPNSPGIVFTPSATGAGVTLTVNPGGSTGMSATTLSLQSSQPTANLGDSVTLTATLGTLTGDSPAATGMVSFFDNGAPIGTGNLLATGAAQFVTNSLPAGTDNITATYSGDSFYSSTSAGQITQIVNNPVTTPPETIGGLDPTFGSDGLATHSVGFASTNALLLQSDGKSVIVGTVGASPSETFGVTRYNADGSLDTSFGNDGVTDTGVGGDDQAAAGFVLPDGDILVAGTATTFVKRQAAGSQFALAEYTPGGVLDTSFGNGAGYVLTSFSSTASALSNDLAHAITVSAAGEIFVGGSSDADGNGQDFAIAAYNPDGSLATAFGSGGKVLLDFSGGDDSVAALVQAPKVGLLAVGSSVNPATGVGSVAMAAFENNGALNGHFGEKGKVTTSVGSVDDAASSVAIGPKNEIVVGGSSATGSASEGTLSSDFLLLRYTTAGKLDHTFNGSGTVLTSFNQPAAVTSVLADADGTIVASGKTAASLTGLNAAELELAVARYTSNGRLDTSFNQTGQAVFNLVSAATTQSLQPAGVSPENASQLVPLDATSNLMAEFNQLTQSDQGVIAMTSGGDLLDVGNNDANTVEAAIVAMGVDLAAAVISTLPNAVVGGAKGTISVQITEDGNELASGAVTVSLSAATLQNATVQQPFQSVPETIKFKQGQAKTFKLKFSFPSSLADGNYYVQATVNSGALHDLNVANNTASSAAPVDIAAPFIDLAPTGLSTPAFVGAKPANISFTVTNDGNIPTPTTPSSVQFLVSADGTLAGAMSIATIAFKPNLKPSMSRVFKSKVALPTTVSAGTYYLLAVVDPANVYGESNAINNLVASGGTFVVG